MTTHGKKKRKEAVQALVHEVIGTYEQNGRETDPLGMYTGVTREVREMPEVYSMAAYPDTKTPTDAILDGKMYKPAPADRADAEPVQDADDL